MGTSFGAAATAAVFLLGSAYSAKAEIYDGPGFAGTAWFNGESGKVEKAGTINVGRAGFLINMVSEGQKVSSLFKWNSETVWSLMHDQKMYMEMSQEQIGWEPYEDRACRGYANEEKQGSETLAGRATEKWRCTDQTAVAPGGTPSDATVWYDPELQFGVKSVEDNGNIFEIRDIERGAQAASLFKVPDDYQKLDMSAMMEQLMQQQQ